MEPVSRIRNAYKPTDRQPMPRHVKVELSLKDKKSCMLCGHKEISEQLYGPLYKLDDVVVHHLCILLSSRYIQNGADNGFLLKDIRAELYRASKQNCFYCKKNVFRSFCQKHCIQQTIDLSELKKSTSPQCAI